MFLANRHLEIQPMAVSSIVAMGLTRCERAFHTPRDRGFATEYILKSISD
jgi:hypothetical protein